MFHKTHEVHIGNPANGAVLKIGGGLNGKPRNPIVVQSMTNTDTADVAETVAQIFLLCDAGAEMVRITVNNFDAAKAVPRIKEKLLKKGYTQPIIGDFHYNGHILLANYPDCAKALDKYRINPGNVGAGAEEGENFAAMVKTAVALNKPVRIGVNWGSLDPEIFLKLMDKNARLRHPRAPEEITREAVVQSALKSAKAAEKLGLPADKIVLSVKMSAVQDVVAAYEKLASLCNYALHLGLTEAGSGDKGLIASTAALAILLQKGIGDTIRISLTPGPGQSRAREVIACQLLLQTMGIRNFRPLVTSCPGCGRTANDLHQKIAAQVTAYIDQKLPVWRKKYSGAAQLRPANSRTAPPANNAAHGRAGATLPPATSRAGASLDNSAWDRIASLKIAVMGCIVNGPGEASHADIAISLPGKTEEPVAQVYLKGKPYRKLTGKYIAAQFIKILDAQIAARAK